MTLRLLVIAALAVVLSGCVSANAAEPTRVELTVFAASSLTEAFHDLERDFERLHPDIDVQLVFGGSQVLRLQIEQGAPADVFAAADQVHMDALVSGGQVASTQHLASTELVVAVPTSNPARIRTFEDLNRARTIVVGTEHVPAGRYAREVLHRASSELGETFAEAVRTAIASEESNVRLVRAKLELGEADAAFIYRTDAVASDRVQALPIPPRLSVAADYPIASLQRSPHDSEAKHFLLYVGSPAAHDILTRHGFTPPTPADPAP